MADQKTTVEEVVEDATAQQATASADPILLQKQIDTLTAELAAEKDKYMRLFAEYENFRRRSKQERDALYTDAYADALVTILPVLDNLERAVAFTDGAQIAEGLAMTLKQFADTLAKMGVTEIPTEVFDPQVHNAVLHVEDDSVGEGAIVQVVQKGYKKGDRVIRFAMVQVAN